MNSRLHISALLAASLALNSCGNLGDDSFAHAVKSGNARMAVSTIQPGQARLRIHERNGQVYYPIHYTICRGDREATFGLIENGSPTSLQGRSLAYNAARVKQPALAMDLARSGYGTMADVAKAEEENRRPQGGQDNSAAMAAFGIVALLALMSAEGPTQSEIEEEQQRQHDIYTIMRARGEVP